MSCPLYCHLHNSVIYKQHPRQIRQIREKNNPAEQQMDEMEHCQVKENMVFQK